MTLCNQQNLETQHGIGRSKVGYARAFNRALKDLLGNGATSCIGGTCAGGDCNFYLNSMDAQYATQIQPNGTLVYEVRLSGEGSCNCD